MPGAYVLAQQPAAPAGGQPAAAQQQPMSFFVTSVGKGDGANLGGLAGADAHCAGARESRRDAPAARCGSAYLSTQGAGAVSARDRIGKGPWHNFRGQVISADIGILHGDTIEQARIGNPLGKQLALTEKGELVNGVGDKPNQHDILTGSTADGRAYTDTADHTCNNWTSNSAGSAQLGHSDKQGGGNSSWNSTHAEQGLQPGQPDRHRRRGTPLLLRRQVEPVARASSQKTRVLLATGFWTTGYCRSAVTGSTRIARSAGTATASSATSISDTPTLTSVIGSVGSIPNRIVRMPLHHRQRRAQADDQADRRPASRPRRESAASRSTGLAPSVSRTPISGVRSDTRCAITP